MFITAAAAAMPRATDGLAPAPLLTPFFARQCTFLILVDSDYCFLCVISLFYVVIPKISLLSESYGLIKVIANSSFSKQFSVLTLSYDNSSTAYYGHPLTLTLL